MACSLHDNATSRKRISAMTVLTTVPAVLYLVLAVATSDLQAFWSHVGITLTLFTLVYVVFYRKARLYPER